MKGINNHLCFFNIAEKIILVEKGAIFFIRLTYLLTLQSSQQTNITKLERNKVQQRFDILPGICYSAFILNTCIPF